MLLASLTSPTLRRLRRTVGAFGLALAAGMFTSGAALAEKGLPKPHVSPALDAVLLPITAEVRKEFKLGKKAAGVVVVSVDPGGVGELYGLEPGEVITELDDKAIRRPVDLDSMIRYKLKAGTNYFFFEGTWKNKKKKTIVELTNEDYEAPIALENISKWRAYNAGGARGKRGSGYRGDDGYYYAGGGFYYYDFCDSYYDDFYEIYDYTLIYVEEIIVTEVYITSIESSETYFYYDDAAAGYDWPDDDYYLEEVDAYYSSDEFVSAYDSTDYFYEDEAYDPETGLGYEEAEEYGYLDAESYEEGYDEAGATMDDGSVYEDPAAEEYSEEPVTDESYVDDGSGYEDPAPEEYSEEPVYEETYEEPAAEEYSEEPVYEETYEEPAAEEYYEEPVYEETYEETAAEEYYEEPVYEETYEEPTYDEGSGGGGDCYVDENGYEVCG
ncbi:MAG: hypothetical protein JNK34_03300 [Tabrizicola sp.]|nr:hypothetical protein [Tabrizicola sp.]